MSGTMEQTGELEAFDTLKDPVTKEGQAEFIVGRAYTTEEMSGIPGTWQPLDDGSWEYQGLLPYIGKDGNRE